MTDEIPLAERFETQRPRLRAIALQLLGSNRDADDAVQEAWMRLARADAASIDNLEAWLTTVVSRICLDILGSARIRHERAWQVEAWPVEAMDASGRGDPEREALSADRVSVALLVVLEQLSPAERIAFVLHDVFALPFDDIARTLDRSAEAVRQLASRARRRLRGAPDEADAPSPGAAGREIVRAWLSAVQDGDFGALLSLLSDGAVLHADYGSSSESLHGAAEIAGRAALAARLAAHSQPVLIDGLPGVAVVERGRVVSLMAFTVADGRIVRLDVLADLTRIDQTGAAEAVAHDHRPE
ncbi:sigma-70 family RNA polymerase sigma factor [Microbacterium rhizosphaerae]|uniref:Sigma-70 family RNA polymerase sigma factor n=1 Tax=Microbacterium rhizosphaerae TaxID=1678237 RepID=A0ABZ0SQS0_9MICO|nr:sigma-70 family RNA polymerase sigma factor [Microbacterium rhizosphaerae]WPR91105.1 sigma-70 family RNA polymerase sigma factor [Microbacterium rhizosphaerae]